MPKAKPPKTPFLFIDQYNNHFFAFTVKELRDKIGLGGSRVKKMYVNTKDGRTWQTGYVIGEHWLKQYKPVVKEFR